MEALISGGIDAFWLAQAEAAAQEAAPSTALSAAELDASMPHAVWSAAAVILHETSVGVSPVVARALAKRGAVWPLLRVGSCTRLR